MVFVQCKTGTTATDPRGSLYAGAKACANCHSNIYQSFLHTAHYLASAPAAESTVHGSFAAGSNVFNVNKTQKVVMEKKDGDLFQSYYLNGTLKDQYRFDIVFGGVKGESYLYWKKDELYQLPLSYFSAQRQWSTSPGYKFDFLDYPHLRSIGKGCLECHASYIDNLPGEAQTLDKLEKFDKHTLVYSIDCERCHGPGAQHVNFQINNPAVKTASFITKFSNLSRGQKLDACAVCHSGKPGVMLRSAFEFLPGDTLAKFRLPGFFHPEDTGHTDVHGNQLQLLQSSKCFINSNMDCATCHDTHQNNRGNRMLYTQKCLACHQGQQQTHCKMTDSLRKDALEANCISCHMPALPTKTITVQVSDTLPFVQFLVHTHRIAVYPQEVKKVLERIYQ